mmetsp:Transcript_34470/g.61989  ORF Transcript_34470/g.61989 Transcript_34470/m.61989 type:complete len:82 (+) Transcript_34470:1173-1418(+)
MAASCLRRLGFQQGESPLSAALSNFSLPSDCDWRVVGIIREREERGGADFGACNVVVGGRVNDDDVPPRRFDDDGGENADT